MVSEGVKNGSLWLTLCCPWYWGHAVSLLAPPHPAGYAYLPLQADGRAPATREASGSLHLCSE